MINRVIRHLLYFYFLLFGTMIVATIPLLYIFARLPWHIYVIQFIYGLANSMAVPGWRILFTDHIDEGKTGYEWSLQDVEGGIAVGVSAYLGAVLAQRYGFPTVLTIVSILGYTAAFLLLFIYKDAKTLKQIKAEHELKDLRSRRRGMLAVGTHHVK